MMIKFKLNCVVIVVVMFVGLLIVVMVQEILLGIIGSVVGFQGVLVVGIVIIVKYVLIGSVKIIIVNVDGQFSLFGLCVGGLYEIIMDFDKFEDVIIIDVYLLLSEFLNLSKF